MYFGDEKIRQMARSILPSTMRNGARRRALIHRAVRRDVHQSLASLIGDPDLWGDGVSWGEKAAGYLRYFVQDRRSLDKLNHFQRWAVERTWQLPLSSRLGAMRAVLPGGLIGQHAISHLEHNRLITSPRFLREPWCAPTSTRMNKGDLAELLREVLRSPDGHRVLNRTLRDARRMMNNEPRMPGPRRLHGFHDVLAFIDWLKGHDVSRDVVQCFARAWRITHNAEFASKEACAPRELTR